MYTQNENYAVEWIVMVIFSTQEHLLRSVQYLPDIVQLQRQLYDMCNRRIDLAEAEKTAIVKFLRTHVNKGVYSSV